MFLEYLETDAYFSRQEHLLANIARSVFQVNAAKGQSVPLEPFLLKLKPEGSTNELDEKERAEKISRSKSFWKGFMVNASITHQKEKEQNKKWAPANPKPIPKKLEKVRKLKGR